MTDYKTIGGIAVAGLIGYMAISQLSSDSSGGGGGGFGGETKKESASEEPVSSIINLNFPDYPAQPSGGFFDQEQPTFLSQVDDFLKNPDTSTTKKGAKSTEKISESGYKYIGTIWQDGPASIPTPSYLPPTKIQYNPPSSMTGKQLMQQMISEGVIRPRTQSPFAGLKKQPSSGRLDPYITTYR